MVDIEVTLPTRKARRACAAHLTSAVYIGRWWPALDEVALGRVDRDGHLDARWRSATSTGRIRCRPERSLGDGVTVQLTATLPAAALLAGAPLVAIRATLLSEDGQVLATAHLPFTTRSDGALGTARGRIHLATSDSLERGGRLRIDLGVARYRSTRVGQAMSLGISSPESASPDDPLHLESAVEPDDAMWHLSSHVDDEPPIVSERAVIYFALTDTADGEDVRLDELSARERANRATIGRFRLPIDPTMEDPVLQGTRVTAVDVIFDGVAPVLGPTSGARDGDDILPSGGPILRVYLFILSRFGD